ncbi:MAG TPA: DUF1592 domain-containing protein [Polyangiaceae bacterium]|nr:DUF1592 domain-containing protein [Polyangiaceae bacterium]
MFAALGCSSSVGGGMGESDVDPGAGTSAGVPGAGEPGSGVPGGGPPGGTGAEPAIDCVAATAPHVGLTKLRRLTRSEFNHTVRDLIGIDSSPADVISPDERIGPFDSNATAPITELLVQQHGEVAARLARDAVARMAEIASCDLAAGDLAAGDLAGDATCPEQFVASFGLKAFRRPLDQAEQDAYLGLYRLGSEQGAEGGFRLVLEAMLQSPSFLYHADVGQLGAPSLEPAPLTPFELASRLSYFLWDTMPDDALFDLAQSGTLNDAAVLEEQVRRMLDDPRAAEAIPNFHLQWLGIRDMEGVSKAEEYFPGFGPELVQAMIDETANFTDHVVRRGDGLLGSLFTASYSVIDGPLFELYGVEPPADYTPGDPVELDPSQRSGILTQAAFLATHAHHDQTSPVHRGLFVRENILCQTIPPPPANVIPTPPPPTPGTTVRERISLHQSEQSCSGCHRMMDNIGLGFESYDASGVFRSEEAGRPVDDTGELIATGDAALDGPFDGALELSQKLADSPVVQKCVTQQWFRFALGRSSSNDDACSLEHMQEQFVASGGNVRELIVSLATSDAFRNVRLVGQTVE